MSDLTAENIIFQFQWLSAHFFHNFQDLCYTISAIILCIFNGFLAQVETFWDVVPAVHSEEAILQC